jgi:phage I-like protein
VEKNFTEDAAICNKCILRKCIICQQRKHVQDYYKENNTTCKKCTITLTSNRRKVGIVSLHDKVDKILDTQGSMLEKQESYAKQLRKQMALLQDLIEKVDSMDKEMAKLTKRVKKITMDQ